MALSTLESDSLKASSVLRWKGRSLSSSDSIFQGEVVNGTVTQCHCSLQGVYHSHRPGHCLTLIWSLQEPMCELCLGSLPSAAKELLWSVFIYNIQDHSFVLKGSEQGEPERAVVLLTRNLGSGSNILIFCRIHPMAQLEAPPGHKFGPNCKKGMERTHHWQWSLQLNKPHTNFVQLYVTGFSLWFFSPWSQSKQEISTSH